MRPTRLELTGFTAFREHTAVDLVGADLFALVGPTGSGKSSLIDAVCFALYGHVPRLDRRAVAPVVAAGKNEARVRLDFTVGEHTYTAVRVVRRTKQGATTKEARLECGADVLASEADDVTTAVEDLLGLGFEQFTKCVVLPQGEFARFLHDKPRDRQELLVRMLELGLYDRMRQAANARKASADAHVERIDAQLADLDDATPERLDAADRRLAELASLRDALDEAQPTLDALAQRIEEAAKNRQQATECAAQLDAVAVPDDVAALAGAVTEAERALEQAQTDADAATQRVGQAEAARDAVGDRATLEKVRDAHQEAASLRERIATGENAVAEARRREAEAREQADAADRHATEAEADRDRVRRAHAADELAAHLEPGAACPVCAQPVASPPAPREPEDLDAADARVEAAREAAKAAQATLTERGKERATADQQLRSLRERLDEVAQSLDGRPDADETTRLLDELGRAEAELASAKEAERSARAALRQRTEEAKTARARRDDAWTRFDATRDGLAALGPPAIERSDLAAAWDALATWAGQEAERQRRAAAEAQQAEAAARTEREEALAGLTRRCTDAGVEVGDRRPRDVVTEAHAAANEERRRLAADLDTAAKLRTERQTQAERSAVADTLAGHLKANRFEQWVLDEALTRLAAGASETLRGLSGGQYSLAVDDHRNFAVVDHHNADERRSARTLSGGETFLASLALALTLSEHLSEMAVGGAPQLESIFLDEGFGALDPDTLDVVAATVEELGATGRTVGVVTHVRELAERIPLRYEVRKGPAGSTVECVGA